MKKVELLAPAGNFESLKAAVNYGADAVYLGGTSFSARAFANNFDNETLIEAVKYCHLRGVKVYVTLNTLLNENEIENAYKQAIFYYENNVDALIIQDLGLFYRLKKDYPDFELHASTQMHIHNLNGVRNAKELGFAKVVVARESSLDLIKDFCKEGISIECFVHGAICVSYSGQCLMSSVTKNRSANKGLCAQCCRLRYKLYDLTDKKYIDTNTDYLLSPKDMFLLEDIPSLIEAGVSSFKIEGRLKSPTYVGLVTKIYREAIDAYYDHRKFNLTNENLNKLLSVFNRGFSDTYLLNNSDDLFNNLHPNHLGIPVGKVIKVTPKRCFIKLSDNINQFDGIRIVSDNYDYGKILNILNVNGKYSSAANKNDIIEIDTDKKVNVGDIVVKTLDSKLENEINEFKPRKREVVLNILMIENKKVIVEAKLAELSFKKIFENRPQVAKNSPLSEDDVINQFSKTNDSPFVFTKFNLKIGNIFMPKSELNSIRREFLECFEEHVLNSFKRNVIKPLKLNDYVIENYNEPIIYNRSSVNINNSIKETSPVVNYNNLYNNSDIVTEFGGILSKNFNKVAYYTFNCSNSYAYEFLLRLGFKRIILSTELDDSNVELLINGFKQRNREEIKPYVLYYGRRTLMYFRRNPIDSYYINDHKYEISDDKNNYLLEIHDDYTELREKEAYFNENINLNNVNMFIIVDSFLDIEFIEKYMGVNMADRPLCLKGNLV